MGFSGRRIRVSLLLLALAVPGLSLAQTTLGRVAGTVLDTSGAVLPGATITLTNQQTNQSQTTVSNQVGGFVFPGVQVGTYKVDITLEGFKSKTYTDVVVNVGQEYSLTARLDLGALAETVTVEAGSSLVKTTTPEVSSTVLQRQMLDIPLANRDVTNLIKAQAGVQAFINRTNTSINGGRPTWTQVTLDGINIQDNFIRINSLDFLPNRPTSDNVAEFSITTAVAGADTAGGATTVRMVTPSGIEPVDRKRVRVQPRREVRGELVLQQRLGREEARTQPTSVRRPRRRTDHQEPAVLLRQLRGIPPGNPVRAEHHDSRQPGSPAGRVPLRRDRWVAPFGERDAALRAADRRKAPERAAVEDPSSSNVNNYDVGNSTSARLLNTAGYRFNQTDLNNRDQYVFRGDFELSDKHRFEGVYSYFKEIDDRTDLDFISPDRPLVYTSSDPEAICAGVALAPVVEVPERAARRRQPGAGAVHHRLGLLGGDPVQHRSEHHESRWRRAPKRAASASWTRAATPTPIS